MTNNFYGNNKGVPELTYDNFEFNSLQKSPIISSPYKGHQGMIMVYAPWCGHCANPELRNMYITLSKELKKHDIYLTAINSTKPENEPLVETLGVQGFPTLMYFNKSGKLSEYKDSRDMESIIKHFIKNK